MNTSTLFHRLDARLLYALTDAVKFIFVSIYVHKYTFNVVMNPIFVYSIKELTFSLKNQMHVLF